MKVIKKIGDPINKNIKITNQSQHSNSQTNKMIIYSISQIKTFQKPNYQFKNTLSHTNDLLVKNNNLMDFNFRMNLQILVNLNRMCQF